ncbi:hypothetical protein EJ110_NYTH16135 [Nymphaea thermarum]|nr:hypothetical protein EJ110_NYTH16135 [Nymphaea thermarum]
MSRPMNQWRGGLPVGRVQQWLPISVSRVGCGYQGRLDGCWAPVRMRTLEQCSQSAHTRVGHGVGPLFPDQAARMFRPGAITSGFKMSGVIEFGGGEGVIPTLVLPVMTVARGLELDP